MPIECMPASPDMERLVLGSILLDSARMGELRDALDVEDFSLEPHKRIWRTMTGLYDGGASPDRATLAEEMHRTGRLEAVGGLAYLTGLDVGLPRLPSLDGYVKTLQDKAFLRRVALAASELEKRALMQADDPASIAEYAHSLLATLQAPRDRAEFLTPADIFEQAGIDRVLHPRRGIDSIPMPWPWLDTALGGISPEQLIVVGGRTSQGKTSAATQVILNAVMRGFRTAVFSLEMSKESLMRKFTSQISGIDQSQIKHNHLDRDTRAVVHRAAGELIETQMHVCDTGAFNVVAISAMLRRLRTKVGPLGLVVVDHLHALSSSGKTENRTQQIGADVRALKLLAKEFRCPFVVPAQLNNATTRDNAKPNLADLRQSGEIAENADVVWFVWLDLNDDSKFQKGDFIVAKQREGYRDIKCKMQFVRGTQIWREAE